MPSNKLFSRVTQLEGIWDWLSKKAKQAAKRLGLRKFEPRDFGQRPEEPLNKFVLVNQLVIGHMYLFQYDAKLKKTLPYWDMFPLIFVIEKYNDGFLGINLHYLPPKDRAKLVNALQSLTTDRKYNEKTKLKISYNILKSATKYKSFKPCIKRYLTTHVSNGAFLKIHAYEWEIATLLPFARFQKKSTSRVWKDSLNKI